MSRFSQHNDIYLGKKEDAAMKYYVKVKERKWDVIIKQKIMIIHCNFVQIRNEYNKIKFIMCNNIIRDIEKCEQ